MKLIHIITTICFILAGICYTVAMSGIWPGALAGVGLLLELVAWRNLLIEKVTAPQEVRQINNE